MQTQPTLFNSKTMRTITSKRPPRLYGPNDVFPYGVWKGKKLSVVGFLDPHLVEYWIAKSNVRVSGELLTLIAHAKLLAK